LTSVTCNNTIKVDPLYIFTPIQQKHARQFKSSKEILMYEEAKEKLLFIWFLRPPIDQIVKYLKLMHKLLCKEWGFLCKGEIIDKIFNDVAASLGLSKKEIRKLILSENI